MKLLLLTNAQNGSPEEDIFVSTELRKYFTLIIAHPKNAFDLLETVDAIAVRNIWPTYEYRPVWTDLCSEIRNRKIPCYNPLTGKADINGKRYLIDLFKEGYPVVPSIGSTSDLAQLPQTERYWIKPLIGCDGYGAKQLRKSELETEEIHEQLIQPLVEFASELSLYFIDNAFLYAVETKNRLLNPEIVLYKPPESEIEFARQFVAWNALPYGLQRIDLFRLKDGNLLLNEIEDDAPYLYLFEIPEAVRTRVLNLLRQSLEKNLSLKPQ